MPKVTVITPTYNRPADLPCAIRSVVDQELQDWEMLVVNDGGVDVGHVVDGFADDRIRYASLPENRGKAACLNLALREARGSYVAYLDDDDLWYPNHLAVLAETLDNVPEAAGAYSDLYRVAFVRDEQGNRYPLDKRVEISRDYNRMFMFYYNHVLHVSLMHRRDLALHAGGYDEGVRILIDWNLTRKLSFYADLVYVPAVTGEYYAAVVDSDRISDVQRRDEDSYRANLRRIRADLPPEPWPMVHRVAVVLPVSAWDDATAGSVRYLADNLSYPCRIVLVDMTGSGEGAAARALGPLTDLANLRIVPSPLEPDTHAAYARGIGAQDADYYYLASTDAQRDTELRLIRAVCFMRDTGCSAVRWPEDGPADGLQNVMVTADLAATCVEHPGRRAALPVVEIPMGWLPRHLRADLLLHAAREGRADGNHALATGALTELDAVGQGGAGHPYLAQLHADVALAFGNYARAEDLCEQLVARGYGPDNCVRLGRIRQRRQDFEGAVEAYRRGLDAIGLPDAALESSVFPFACDEDFDAFRATQGLGECLLELGRYDEAAPVLRRAARLRVNSVEPNLAFGRLFLCCGDTERAEQAFRLAEQLAREGDRAAVEDGLAAVFEQRGDWEQAGKHAREAFCADPANESYALRAARAACVLGRLAEGAEVYRQFLSHRPGHVEALVALAGVCRRLGRGTEADDLAERAELLRPGSTEGTAQAL